MQFQSNGAEHEFQCSLGLNIAVQTQLKIVFLKTNGIRKFGSL